ncbi:MJ1477/TM1410 family putative glycoside hydrolase [Nanoarchaeota archaeon]
MKKLAIILMILALFLTIGCEDTPEREPASRPAASQQTPTEISEPVDVSDYDKQTDSAGSVMDVGKSQGQDFGSFHYQLQEATYPGLKAVDADVLVIDIDDADISEEELNDLKKDGKTILSYLSIGEAEDYREYWQDSWKPGSPSFIDSENPGWEGNYKVRYWDMGWQDIILDRAEEIAEAGYDGVYLDIIDAYGYYEDRGRDSAAQEMVDFVRSIRQEAQKVNPSFIVVPQNSPELYAYPSYAEIIVGFGKEDTWYDDDSRQDEEETAYVLGYLDKAVADGRFVLAIDYPTGNSEVCDFYKKCSAHGFACTVSDRELDLDRQIACKN